MNLKTRLLSGASVLAIAGGVFVAAAPAAPAEVTQVGACEGQALLATFYNSANALAPLTDVTQKGVTVKTKLLSDQTTKAKIAGDCDTATRPGEPGYDTNGEIAALTPKAVAGKLVGNASCYTTDLGGDPNEADAWPLSGKIVFTGTQLNDLGKPVQIQAQITVLGFDPVIADAVNVGGIVLKGPGVGATAGGQIWFDPVAKTGGATGYNTGYELDLGQALGCADETPNNAALAQVMVGGGGATSTSLLGSEGISGITFSIGQPDA